MSKIIISNTPEEFFELVRKNPHNYEGAIRLENARQLYGINEAEVVVLPGAEEHPLLSNYRLKQLRDRGVNKTKLTPEEKKAEKAAQDEADKLAAAEEKEDKKATIAPGPTEDASEALSSTNLKGHGKPGKR